MTLPRGLNSQGKSNFGPPPGQDVSLTLTGAITGIGQPTGTGNTVIINTTAGSTGVVTSVGVDSTSLEVSGSPITSSGNITVDLPEVGNLTFLGTVAGGNTTASPIQFIAGGNITLTPGGTGNLTISAAGAGNVSGPGSSTDRAIATWNSTTGTLLRDNPGATITSGGNITASNIGNITPTNLNGNTTTFLNGSGNWTVPPGTSTGTVTSVGVTSSSLSVGGSPVTTSGNITVNLPSVGNLTFLGQGSGGPGTATGIAFVAGTNVQITGGGGNVTFASIPTYMWLPLISGTSDTELELVGNPDNELIFVWSELEV